MVARDRSNADRPFVYEAGKVRVMPNLQTSVFGPYEFVVRRLHSLVGLIPIGAYMVVHLATNASMLDGPQMFQSRVDQINSLGPTTLTLVEWTFIFLPILFHGMVGMIIVLRGERNVARYPYAGNFRYTLQRWTGVIAFVFILFHVFQMHGWFRAEWWHDYVARPLGGASFNPQDAAATAAAAIQSSKLVEVVYLVGVLACIYHFANGLWTMGITWGIWTTPKSQRWANIPAGVGGLLLLVIGLAALFSLQWYRVVKPSARLNPSPVRSELIPDTQVTIGRPASDGHPAGEL